MSTYTYEMVGLVDNMGEKPSLLNSRQNILAVTIPFMVLSWVFGLMRLFTRFFILKCPGWDDLFVLLALLTTGLGSTFICIATNKGMGRHFLLLDLDELEEFFKALYVMILTYPISSTFIKLALLFQYLRVLEKGTVTRRLTIGVIVLVAAWGLAYSMMALVPSVPVSGYWRFFEKATRYGFASQNVHEFVFTYISHAASNVVLDLLVWAIPVSLFLSRSNRRDRRTRCCLVGLLSLGFLVMLLSVWRTISLVETRAATYPTFDPTWYGVAPIVLSALEVDLAVACASLPVFWPVLQRAMPVIFVTHEIQVTRSHRRISCRPLNRGNPGLELQSLKEAHYRDSYVMNQVDPLSPKNMGVGCIVEGKGSNDGQPQNVFLKLGKKKFLHGE